MNRLSAAGSPAVATRTRDSPTKARKLWRLKSSGPSARATTTDSTRIWACGISRLTTLQTPPRTTDADDVTPRSSIAGGISGLCHTIAGAMAEPGADDPRLSVVVTSSGPWDTDGTVASIHRSATVAAALVEIVVVWSGGQLEPAVAGAVVVTTFPVGASHARNVGAAAATAPRLAFVGADVEVEPGWAGAVIGALDGEGADVAAGPIVSAAGPGSTALGPAGGGPRWHEGASRRPWSIASGGNLAVRRDRFLEVGGFDLRMGPGGPGRAAEDIELVARLLAAGARVRWRPDMVVRRVGPAARPRGGGRDGFGAGRMARRLGAPALAVGYAADVSRTVAAAIRDGSVRRLGEAASAGVGFAAGFATPDRARSPVALLDRLPATIRRALHGRRLRPWPVPTAAGRTSSGRPGTTSSSTSTSASPTGSPPACRHATPPAGRGSPGCRPSSRWPWSTTRRGSSRNGGRGGAATANVWTLAADWAVALARTAGTPLRETGWWSRAGGPAAAMEALGDLPAVVVHGDLQAKNLLVDRAASIGVLDWEGAEDAGPPGFDLLFLAVASRRGAAERRSAVAALAAGRDPAGLAVQERLRAVGLDDGTARAALAVALHRWAAAEADRRRSLGAPPQPAEFGPLAATWVYSAS